MKLYCQICKKYVTVELIFSAEKKFNTETKEVVWNALDFSHIECPECYYNFGDERDLPKETLADMLNVEKFRKLVVEAEKAT